MQVSVARRVEPKQAGELVACSLLGFGVGIAAGFVLSEFFGSGGHRRMSQLLVQRRRAGGDPDPLSLAARVRAALQADLALAGLSLEVRLRGRGLELRGWVESRSARAQAYRVARAAAGGGDIANHLRVRGEDDHPGAPIEAPRSA
jgi:hypothetical protein